MGEWARAFEGWFAAHGAGPEQALWLSRACGAAAVVVLAVLANWVAKRVVLRVVGGVARRTASRWDDALVTSGVFKRLSHVAPALVVHALAGRVVGDDPSLHGGVADFVSIYLIVISVAVLSALLDAVVAVVQQSDTGKRLPVRGFTQATMLVAVIVAGVFVLSIVFGKSPIYFLSGFGALTAVLLLVFRDALLGLAAGIMISANELVRVGDWIEMPKAGADGDVVDLTLTTVKVRNWDKTITTIPAYSLISDSFKNWRGMQESGGRRIKRSLSIDMHTVRFADEAMLERWRRMRLLKPYLEEKLAENAAENAARGEDLGVLGNGRRLTNLGTFRAYCVAYLKANPRIHQEMTFLVRHLQPTEHGLPVEIYVFTNDTRWAVYEGIQADILDHLLAVLPQFELKVFQAPSGGDVREAALAMSGPGRAAVPAE